MRPNHNSNLQFFFCAIAVCGLCCAATQRADAQSQFPNSYPARVASIGNTQESAREITGEGSRSSLREVGSAWTANSNPLSTANAASPSQLTPAVPLPSGYSTPIETQQSFGTQSSYVDRSVVSASAEIALHSSASDSAEIGASKHIPLKPPSARFTGAEPERASSSLQTFFSVGSSLLVVMGLFLGVAWCYRKTLHASIGGGLPKQVVSILGRTSISTRQQMVLVRFGPKLLLVSVIQGEARTLSEITDPLEVDQLAGLCESGHPGSITNSFKSVLLQERA